MLGFLGDTSSWFQSGPRFLQGKCNMIYWSYDIKAHLKTSVDLITPGKRSQYDTNPKIKPMHCKNTQSFQTPLEAWKQMIEQNEQQGNIYKIPTDAY